MQWINRSSVSYEVIINGCIAVYSYYQQCNIVVKIISSFLIPSSFSVPFFFVKTDIQLQQLFAPILTELYTPCSVHVLQYIKLNETINHSCLLHTFAMSAGIQILTRINLNQQFKLNLKEMPETFEGKCYKKVQWFAR